MHDAFPQINNLLNTMKSDIVLLRSTIAMPSGVVQVSNTFPLIQNWCQATQLPLLDAVSLWIKLTQPGLECQKRLLSPRPTGVMGILNTFNS